MINNSYLEQIFPAIKDPLNEQDHKIFLIKMEELQNVATKIKFLFTDKSFYLMSDFVLQYQKLLMEMYKYKIIIDKMNGRACERILSLEEAQESVGEESYRKELEEAINNLKETYAIIENENIEKQLEQEIRIC